MSAAETKMKNVKSRGTDLMLLSTVLLDGDGVNNGTKKKKKNQLLKHMHVCIHTHSHTSDCIIIIKKKKPKLTSAESGSQERSVNESVKEI